MHTPKGKDTGFGFVLRTIKKHQHMGAGLWILGFIVYYWFFAWPWWSRYVEDSSWKIIAILAKNPSAWYWNLAYILHTFAVGCVAWSYMDFPLGTLPLQVLLYTVYLTLCPPLLVYGRFHMSRAAWKHHKVEVKKNKNKKQK